MKRAVWVLAIIAVLLVISFVTLVQWNDNRLPASHQQEHLTMPVTDRAAIDEEA